MTQKKASHADLIKKGLATITYKIFETGLK